MNDKLIDWKIAQRSIYDGTTARAQTIADNIIRSKLTKAEMESICLIISLERMIRVEQREQKKIIKLESIREPDADDRRNAKP